MRADTRHLEFDWDTYNKYKSVRKHAVLAEQTESVFKDKNKIQLVDKKHSVAENREIMIGKDFNGDILFIVFTKRNNKIRPISSRPAGRQERLRYENQEQR